MLAARSRALFRLSRRAIAPQARLFAYTATAKTTGKGCSGEVEVDGGAWKLPDTNDSEPLYRKAEDYFSMGIASCYLGTLYALASQMGKREVIDSACVKVAAGVSLGREGTDKPGVTVTIIVEGVEDEELLEASHQASVYPYLAFDRVRFNIESR